MIRDELDVNSVKLNKTNSAYFAAENLILNSFLLAFSASQFGRIRRPDYIPNYEPKRECNYFLTSFDLRKTFQSAPSHPFEKLLCDNSRNVKK